MALNFPNSPADQETYTAEGQTYVWEAASTLWRILTQADSNTVEIVEADAIAGWQVWGDTLVCWGPVITVAGDVTVTLPRNFKNQNYRPIVTAYGTAGNLVCTTNDTLVNQFDVNIRISDTLGTGAWTAAYVAFGEAEDVDKKAKVITGSKVEAYHDPAGATVGSASWSIVGTTLECWGYDADISGAPGYKTITYPKTFAIAPIVTCSPVLAQPIPTVPQFAMSHSVSALTTTAFNYEGTYRSAGTDLVNDGGNDFTWHAVGEWDGIS